MVCVANNTSKFTKGGKNKMRVEIYYKIKIRHIWGGKEVYETEIRNKIYNLAKAFRVKSDGTYEIDYINGDGWKDKDRYFPTEIVNIDVME